MSSLGCRTGSECGYLATCPDCDCCDDCCQCSQVCPDCQQLYEDCYCEQEDEP